MGHIFNSALAGYRSGWPLSAESKPGFSGARRNRLCRKLQLAVAFLALATPAVRAQAGVPDWCRALPRPEYKTLQRVPVRDPWFEVYKVGPAVFAIYEPHQFEETISYLVIGEKPARCLTRAWASAT